MLKRASIPPRPFDLSLTHSRGTPITGRVVIPAITPGRAAARPAPAMITWHPSFSTSSTVFLSKAPALWAEMI